MKAEQRHRLEHNALADRVGKVVQSVKSAPATQSLALWLGVAAVVIVIIAWQLFRSASYIETSGLWRTLDAATRQGDMGVIQSLESLRDEHPGTTVGTSAGFQLARLRLQEGQANLGNSLEFDRKDAIKKLVSVRSLYAQLAKDSVDAPLQMQEAMLMQAKIDESLTGVADPDKPGEMLGSLDRAKEAYQALATKYPDSAAGVAAKKRLEDLEKNKAQIETFYTEFNDILTKPHLPPGPATPPIPGFPPAPKLPIESTPSTGKPSSTLPPEVKPGDFTVPPAAPGKTNDSKASPAGEKGKSPTVPALPTTPPDGKQGSDAAGAKKLAEPAKSKPEDGGSKSSPAADKKK